MELTLTLGGKRYAVELDSPHDLSLPVRFDAEQISVFGAPPAASMPLEAGAFLGSVAREGSCNCEVHTFCAHTSGTHTECVGHITRNAIAIHDVLRETLMPATLLTLAPVSAANTRDSYTPQLRSDDKVLDRAAVEAALKNREAEFLKAVLIRTLPNGPDKRARDYSADNAPFLTSEAVRCLLERGVQHLLMDTPSLDRLDDGGCLSNHRIFWNVAPGSTTAYAPISIRTVTELIYANNNIADGNYLLDLQAAPMRSDAAPSRPLLYGIREI